MRCMLLDKRDGDIWIDFYSANDTGSYKIDFNFVNATTPEDHARVDTFAVRQGLELDPKIDSLIRRQSGTTTWLYTSGFEDGTESIRYTTRSPSNSDKWPVVDSYRVSFGARGEVDDIMYTPYDREDKSFFFTTYVVDYACNHREYHYGYTVFWGKYHIYLYDYPVSDYWERLMPWSEVFDAHEEWKFPRFIISEYLDDLTFRRTQSAIIFYNDGTVITGNTNDALRLDHIYGRRQTIPIVQEDLPQFAPQSQINYATSVIGG